MASTFIWSEDNGAQAVGASGANRGATRTFGVSNVNWKNADDTTTTYSSSPITAGNNSYNKYQFGVFSGSFNQISNVVINHTGGSFGAGLKLAFTGSSGYATPVTTTQSTWADLTLTGLLSTGLPLLLGMNGPQTAHKTTLVTTGYTSYVASQLVTTVSASAGDTSTAFLAISYDES